jgi:hypothetical protein
MYFLGLDGESDEMKDLPIVIDSRPGCHQPHWRQDHTLTAAAASAASHHNHAWPRATGGAGRLGFLTVGLRGQGWRRFSQSSNSSG